MPPKVHDFVIGKVMSSIFSTIQIGLNLSLISQDENIVLDILNATNMLDFFAIEFVGPSVGEIVINEF